MTHGEPLSNLNPNKMTDCDTKKDCHKDDCCDSGKGYGWAMAVVWFIIIVIIIWLIISFAKPDFCGKKDSHGDHTGDLDAGRALLWAIVIAIIIIVFIWLIIWAVGGWYGNAGK